MKSIQVCKADPITDNEPVEDAQINITGKLPEYESLKDAEEFYKIQSMKIMDILEKHLPQGTRHQLMIRMLKSTQNLYRGR